MVMIWDYDVSELKKTKSGRLLILKRMINYGVCPSYEEKISLKEVRENWDQLHLEPKRKRLFEEFSQVSPLKRPKKSPARS